MNYTTTKLNKYYYSNNIKLVRLHNLLQDFFAANLFQLNNFRKIKNILIQQIRNPHSRIIIRIDYFQNDRKILNLMQQLTEEVRLESIRLALENLFNRNLSKRKLLLNTTIAFSIFNKLRC
jgi:hypothetical protein